MQLTKNEQQAIVDARRKVERSIIRTLIEDAFDRGYIVTHSNGEEITASVRVIGDDEVDGVRGRTKAQATSAIMKEIGQCDEEHLTFKEWRGLSKPRKIGWVYLVYGNDGYDVIADYTCNSEMEDLLSGANEFAEKIEEHGYAIV